MRPALTIQSRETLQITFFSIFFLFFLQLLAEFISAIYAFGLLETSLTAEVLSVLLLLAPLVLLAFRRPPTRVPLILLGEAVILCRVIAPLLPTRGIMLTAGLGTGLALVFFPGLLAGASASPHPWFNRALGLGLSLSMAFSILMRALGSGIDASTGPAFHFLGWGLALVAGLLLPLAAREWKPPQGGSSRDGVRPEGRGSMLALAPAGVGIMSVLGCLYFVFMAPSVIARWTETNYAAIVTLLLLSLCLAAIGLSANRPILAGLNRTDLVIWTALFGISLVTTIAGHQVRFPSEASTYPFYPSPGPGLLRIPLVLTLLLSPVILVAFTSFLGAIHRVSPNTRQLGLGFGAGALFLLFLIFAHIFTTVYDYIPVAGPLFRDRFWLVHLLLVMGIFLPQLSLRPGDFEAFQWRGSTETRNAYLVSMASICTSSILLVFLLAARPSTPVEPPEHLRVLTYNIQQGYDAFGQHNLTGQLELVRSLDPHVIGLEESDTARISGGNADAIRFFADHLGLYSYYGPKTVNGTFGIALLSSLPLHDARTLYMYSEGEQTAAINAYLEIGGERIQILVTHLGNGGPLVQQQAVLAALDPQTPTILMGDFNFRPGSEAYSLTATRLLDAWRLKWPRGMDEHGFQPDERIDHIFVSSGLMVDDIRFISESQSDHPALLADLSW